MLQTAQQHTQFNCQSIYLYLVDWLVSFYFVVVTSNYVIAIDSIGSIRTSLVQSSAVRRHRAIGVLVLVVYLKPEAENTRNLTNKTTDINSKLPLLFKVHEI